MHNKKLCSLVSRTHLTNLHSLDYTLYEDLMTATKVFPNMEEKHLWFFTDTPTAKARWVLIYVNFQIYSKVYKTSLFL